MENLLPRNCAISNEMGVEGAKFYNSHFSSLNPFVLVEFRPYLDGY